MFPQDGSQNTYGAPTTVDGFFVAWGNHLSQNICLFPSGCHLPEPWCPPAQEPFRMTLRPSLRVQRGCGPPVISIFEMAHPLELDHSWRFPGKIHSQDPPGPPGSCVSASSHLWSLIWPLYRRRTGLQGQHPVVLPALANGAGHGILPPCYPPAKSPDSRFLEMMSPAPCPPSLIYGRPAKQLSWGLASGCTFRGCCLGRYALPRWLWEQGWVLLPPGVSIFEGCTFHCDLVSGNKRSR